MQIKSRPPKAKLMSLYFLSWIYKFITCFRNLLFNYIKICTSSVPCMVISVGNITTGGTGKTPLTIFLASSLRDKGYTVAILSRGYLRNTSGTVLVSKGNGPICSWEECGDEAYMIANHTSSLPIVVDNKRIRGAKYLLTMFSPDIIVLDDGFQHRSISRDLDILLINGSDKLDDHRLLPLGKLRESWHNAKRSDILIITKRNPAINIAEKIKYLNKPTFRTKSKNYISNACNVVIDSVEKNENVFVFSGIADPSTFLTEVKDYGFSIVGFKTYPDHYRYRKKDMASLNRKAKESGADFMITTDKDWVKIINFEPSYKILAMGISVELENNAEFFKLVESKSKSVTSPKQTQRQQK